LEQIGVFHVTLKRVYAPVPRHVHHFENRAPFTLETDTLDLRSPVAAVHPILKTMDQAVTVIERAFQLAKSGGFAKLK
jgi:hypothetical protein